MNCPSSFRLAAAIVLVAYAGSSPRPACAQSENAAAPAFTPWLEIGGPSFAGWSGLTASADSASLAVPGEAVFRYPQGPKGWYVTGFRPMHDGTRDWRGYYGLQFEFQAPEGRACEFQTTIVSPAMPIRQEYLKQSQAVTAWHGSTQWQRVTIPWTSFDFDQVQDAFLEFIQELRISGKFLDGGSGEFRLRKVRLVRAPEIALDTPVRGKAVQAGGIAQYDVTLANCTDIPQTVDLAFEQYGFEAMTPSVAQARFDLAPGAAAACVVSVHLPKDGIPPGGHESQKLVALGNGGGGTRATLELVTARDVPRPSLLHTPQGWEEMREKVKHYPWARQAMNENVKAADDWQVPEPATPEQRQHNREGHIYVFPNSDFDGPNKCALAWQLTRDRKYAEKIALFLRRLADEKTGYPSTFAATNMGSPQEGGNFQGIAAAYDAILDAGVLSDDDERSIEHTFRLFMETYETDLHVGNMGNWSVAASTAGLFCALAMGDLSAAHRYIDGPAGFDDYLSKGVMDDGWWWECSTSYNFWVAAELTQCALATRPWGVDLLNHAVPASYSPFTIITPWALKPPYGMSFEKWGPNHRNTRSIKQLWDAVPGIADYRGVAFGMNDGHEEAVGGSRMELAYYAFHDPAYVPLIKRSGKRDLLYGVPALPEEISQPYLRSGSAENLGCALLRSQTENRAPREQIQAVFKIGTQGGYHGHFDRVALNTIMRYGRSFWNPETIWYGYPNFMYKFYVQTSMAHNMVVVDQKQQEAVPSRQLLFHTGKMMQAVAHETNARWSDPPYGGMRYDAAASGGAFADLPALMKRNRQSFPIVTDRAWGELGPFTDRVLQRRVGIVTDDYIVVADYLKSEKPHTFDDLFQMKGLQSLDGAGKRLIRHDPQFNADPRSSAQFVTDCDWYQVVAPVVGRFKFEFDPNVEAPGTQHNEDGTLRVDVHSVWPAQQEVILATLPETFDAQQWVSYEVGADGRSLAKGESGMWVLGAVDIDVPVDGAKELKVSVGTENAGKKKSLFLADARLVTADGREIPLADGLGHDVENVEPLPQAGADYYGGPIKIGGVRYDAVIPVQPKNAARPAVIRIAIEGRGAVRFKVRLGSDYPFGDESERRKIYAMRSQGTEARFLTVLEPYEDKPMVKSATATGADTLRVELNDGRAQEIAIQNLTGSGEDISVRIEESKAGTATRQETTGEP